MNKYARLSTAGDVKKIFEAHESDIDVNTDRILIDERPIYDTDRYHCVFDTYKVTDESVEVVYRLQPRGDATLETIQSRKWRAVRSKRDELLSSTDWTMLADTKVNSDIWAEYRQKLRDLPQTFDNPEDVVFPEQPIK